MSDYIKEKVEEIQNILIRSLPPVENMPTAILQQNKIDERLDLIEKVSAKIGRIFQSSLQEMEEGTVERAMWCQFCGDELNCFGCQGIPGRTMEENRKLLLSHKKESGEKKVVRWKNTFVTDSMENFEKASKLRFTVKGKKECKCDICSGDCDPDCPDCNSPKKEKRGR